MVKGALGCTITFFPLLVILVQVQLAGTATQSIRPAQV